MSGGLEVWRFGGLGAWDVGWDGLGFAGFGLQVWGWGLQASACARAFIIVGVGD